ncbi:nucleotidyltransferase family protein [Natronorubrum sulfidifaciens]|uniref:Molybdopterin-guanine dinucleotide biosynthesis protein A n=1 Tax=Natronorubrum sulfidifaciens JCM 14089 TaxID=1230460 RepID=L9W3I4_9EURY|nr:nucleotidyltransferase family protein [Natronorubrum sulfidifaciens]ELY43866.1 molybdopterin-guanine dinucleotide biosynthesis protein A [Natronorubrum sulfidifaciens JCM 14089]
MNKREPTDEPAVAGVILAAGTSSRYGGENKLLATLEGEPIVRHAARTLVHSSVDPVVVVLGHEADRVQAALEGLAVDPVVNEAYDTGQASSLRAGIEAVCDRGDVDAVLVALGDMPFVAPETIETLVSAYAAGAGEALAAAFDGDRGNPVVFDARFFDALTDVDGDIGGREIFLESDSSALIEVDDAGVRRDIDVPDDL